MKSLLPFLLLPFPPKRKRTLINLCTLSLALLLVSVSVHSIRLGAETNIYIGGDFSPEPEPIIPPRHLPRSLPLISPIGPAEIVYNRTRDHCCRNGSCTNWANHLGEEPDSVPTAWHNPITNKSYLISATSWGTWATVVCILYYYKCM